MIPPDHVRTRTRRAAGGFTLLEMIIVLVILVTLIAVVWPNLRRPLGRGLLREAGQQVARHIAEARLLAIESGQTLALRFEPGGGRYVVTPADEASDDAEEGDPLQPEVDPYASRTGDAQVEEPAAHIDGMLPHEVLFIDPLAEESLDQPLPAELQTESTESVPVSDELNALESADDVETWSPAILFYPTGRAENAELRLRGPDGYVMTITLRGLTGAAKLAQPKREFPLESQENLNEGHRGSADPMSEPSFDAAQFEDVP